MRFLRLRDLFQHYFMCIYNRDIAIFDVEQSLLRKLLKYYYRKTAQFDQHECTKASIKY